jgi:hypothetical protein
MQISPTPPVSSATIPAVLIQKTKPAAEPQVPLTSWSNPAAAAALNCSAQLLGDIEASVIRFYNDVDRVRDLASDLHSTNEILDTATDALLNDGSADNDQFVPLLGRAGSGVVSAETKLSSKDLQNTWPNERTDVLATIRQARVISENVAHQLGVPPQ